MKTKLLFLFLILAGFLDANAGERDTVWTTYHWDGIKVSVLGGNLYYYSTSLLKIESDNPLETISVNYADGIIEKTEGSYYQITPTKISTTLLLVNNHRFLLQVFATPNPKIYLNGDKKLWPGIISQEALQNTTGFVVKNKFGCFDFDSGFLTFIEKNGDIYSIGLQDTMFKKNILEGMQTEAEKKLWFENVIVRNPDSTVSLLPDQLFKIVDSYENEFIRKTVNFLPGTTDLNILKTDLRIKIEGNPSQEEIEAIQKTADELNSILKTIQVKIVDSQPNLTMIFDSTYSESILSKKGFQKNDVGFVAKNNSLFFPFQKNMVMYVNTKFEKDYRIKQLPKSIVELLGNFSAPGNIGNDSSIFNYKGKLSYYDKYMLGLLYSEGGEQDVAEIIGQDKVAESHDGFFIIILVFSLVLFMLFASIFQYYGFDSTIKRLGRGWIGSIVNSLLISQVPVFALLILMSGKFFAGDFHEAGMLTIMEFFLVPFSVLSGLLFLTLDLLLKRIQKQWLSAIVNFILSFAAVFIAYQLVFLTKAPGWVSVYVLGWKVLLVGFLIVLYRLYSRIQTQKIVGLIQQKELELVKQKELKIKSDLNALQARINPHFLYNALNSIASLSRIDPEKTESMALSLSKLFRYNLNKGDDYFATLNEEVEMAQTYLGIEKIRFDDRMDFEIELADSLKDFRVPKFILQPLAENAVKHGVSKLKGKGIISIRIFEKESRVFIEIGDNGPAFPEGLISGYGLQNTYDKLKLLYQKPFEVSFVNKPEKKAVIVLSK